LGEHRQTAGVSPSMLEDKLSGSQYDFEWGKAMELSIRLLGSKIKWKFHVALG
jgi:hypothetical protein